jgi:hypothetical protein
MTKSRPWAFIPGLIGVLFLALAGVGEGQPGFGEAGEGIKLALIRLPAVQAELKLTEKQKAEAARIGTDAREAKKAIDAESKAKPKAKAQGEDNPQGGPDPAPDARDAALADLEGRTEELLKKFLDSKQRKRLSEIALQVEGPEAFTKPELIQKLEILDDQLDQIREILGGVRQQQDQAKVAQKRSAEIGNPELEKTTKEQQKVQLRVLALKAGKRGMAEIGKVLSKRQRDRYRNLLGEPFNLAGLADEKGRKLFDPAADLASSLLKMPAVREELKLTEKQVTALDREEPASKVLEPDQRSRLHQLELQGEGPAAFTRPDVARSLNLGEDQVEAIQAVLDGLGDARRQLKDASKEADEARKASGETDTNPEVEKARKDQAKQQLRGAANQLGKGVMARIASILTRGQREIFRKMIGEPFDFSRAEARPAPPSAKDAPGP